MVKSAKLTVPCAELRSIRRLTRQQEMADIDAAFGDVGEFGAADAAAAGMGELSVDDGDAVPPLEPSPGAGEAFSIPGLTDDAPLPEAFAEDPMGPIAQWRLKREQEVPSASTILPRVRS